MLVLSRDEGQGLVLTGPCGEVKIKIARVSGKRVRVVFEAPDDVRILREELVGVPPEGADDVLTSDEPTL